jgi:alkyl sulfatase BDS1-like metallo-beta-lactamase superfamily hydrolase
MAPPDPRQARVAFLLSFKQLAPYRHHYEVWRDFVIMAACSLHNGLFKDQAREEEYLRARSGIIRSPVPITSDQ